MRIIGYLDRPGLIVTVFKNDNKIFVKFEKSMLEQTYKIYEDLSINNLYDIDRLFDSEWMKEIEKTFDEISKARDQALIRFQSQLTETQEEEII